MNPTAALLEACLRALDPGVSVPPLHVGLLVLARLTPLTILGPLFLLRPAPPLGRAGALQQAHARIDQRRVPGGHVG